MFLEIVGCKPYLLTVALPLGGEHFALGWGQHAFWHPKTVCAPRTVLLEAHGPPSLTANLHVPNTLINLLFLCCQECLQWLSSTKFSLFRLLFAQFFRFLPFPPVRLMICVLGRAGFEINNSLQRLLWMRWMCVIFDLHLVFDDRHLLSHLASSLQIALIMCGSYVMQAFWLTLCVGKR